MRRLPPRSRGDFSQYMQGLRLQPDTQLSDFALLAYSGAKLPSDEFSIINPFEGVDTSFEFLLEVAGYRHIQKNTNDIKINDLASFNKNFNENNKEEAVEIKVNDELIGYVNRGLLPSFQKWIEQNRKITAWVEKVNGSPGRPSVYLFIKISHI